MNLAQYKNDFGKLQSLIALFILCIVFGLLSDKFFTVANGLNVMRQISVNICIAVGMTLVILTAGIDLSVGSVLALCGAVTAGLLKNGISIPAANLFVGFTILGAILSGIIVGAVLGFFNGFVITKFKVPPFVATLAMLTIARGFTMLYTNGFPISSFSSSFTLIGAGWFIGLPVPVWIAAIIVVAAILVTKKIKLGRYVYAIGGNENAAKLSGININKVKIIVYTIAGALAAVGGIIVTAGLIRHNPMQVPVTNWTPSRRWLSGALP
jgi:ribose transport system permease protein